MSIVRPISGEDELRVFERVLETSFGTRVSWEAWFERIGKKNLRVLEEKSEIAGGLGFYRMGQYFAGKSVPLAGLAGVAILPQHRGRKLAAKMVGAVLRELSSSFPLAGLYASTATLYRSVGFEQAGTKMTYRITPSMLPRGDRSLPLRTIAPEQWELLVPLYERRARAWTGHLDRTRALWERTVSDRPEKRMEIYVAGEPIEGYAILSNGYLDGRWFDVRIKDLVWSTNAAAMRLVGLLADLRALVGHIDWTGCAADPLVSLLPEQTQEVIGHERWMLRILDVKKALEARGYPDLSMEIHLHVRDPLLESNDGPFVVTIDKGQARVERGGRGEIEIDVRALAAMYSGFARAYTMTGAGLVRGDASSLEAIFAGPEPWCCDHY